MAQPGRHKEAADHAYGNGKQKPLSAVAHHAVERVADQKVRNQRGNAGGEQHGGDVLPHGLPFNNAEQHGAPDGGPDILNVDAPGAEAGGQDDGHGCGVVQFRAEGQVQTKAHEADKAHIEKGSAVAGHGKIVGGNLAGLAEDLLHTGKYLCPIRRDDRRKQKCGGEEAKEQL